MSLITLQANFYEWQKRTGRDDELDILIQSGIHLDKMRNKLIEAALEKSFDYLLLLDADQTFPHNMIEMMIGDFEDNTDVEAVTGIYTWKEPPYLPHVYRKFDEESKKFMIAGGFPLDEIFQVEGAGCGCLMVKACVFKRTEEPWFKFGSWGGSLPMGEDLYFCYKAKPVMVCDPRIRSGHYRMATVGLMDYIKSNNLEYNAGKESFEISEDQLQAIADKHLGRAGKKAFDEFDENEKNAEGNLI